MKPEEFDAMKHMILVTEKMIHEDFWQNEELKKYAVEFANRLINNGGFCVDVHCDSQCIFNAPALGDVFKKHMCAYLDDRESIMAACKQLLKIVEEVEKEKAQCLSTEMKPFHVKGTSTKLELDIKGDTPLPSPDHICIKVAKGKTEYVG